MHCVVGQLYLFFYFTSNFNINNKYLHPSMTLKKKCHLINEVDELTVVLNSIQ
jgi:hypothetical protein